MAFQMQKLYEVAPREGRVSRNLPLDIKLMDILVAPREGRVSRNQRDLSPEIHERGRAPRGACE